MTVLYLPMHTFPLEPYPPSMHMYIYLHKHWNNIALLNAHHPYSCCSQAHSDSVNGLEGVILEHVKRMWMALQAIIWSLSVSQVLLHLSLSLALPLYLLLPCNWAHMAGNAVRKRSKCSGFQFHHQGQAIQSIIFWQWINVIDPYIYPNMLLFSNRHPYHISHPAFNLFTGTSLPPDGPDLI